MYKFGKKSEETPDRLKQAQDAHDAAVEAGKALLKNENFVKFKEQYEEAEKVVIKALFDVSDRIADPFEFGVTVKDMLLKLRTVRILLDSVDYSVRGNNGAK